MTGAHVFAYLCEPEPERLHERVCFNVESRGRIYHLATEDKGTAEGWVAALTQQGSPSADRRGLPDVSYVLAD